MVLCFGEGAALSSDVGLAGGFLRLECLGVFIQPVLGVNVCLADVERAHLVGFSIFYTSAIVANKCFLSCLIGLLGYKNPMIILKMIVNLSLREHIVRHLEVLGYVQ